MEKVFFTSDTHFGHEYVALGRRFDSLEEHDERLVRNWNRVVGQHDRVYHLGDFALGDPDHGAEIAEQLKGKIFLIRGNHERVAEHRKVRDRFEWIKDVQMLKVEGQNIWLSHYAHRTWNKSHFGAWHLYGHSHNSLGVDRDSMSLDVGVDCWNYAPVSFEDLRAHLSMYHRFIPIDHHG